MSSDLVTHPVHVLNCRVVCVLVRDKEGGLNVAAVGVPSLPVEDLVVQVNVVVVDGVIEGDRDHLWDSVTSVVVGAKISGNFGTVLGTEAVRKFADVLVTEWRAVGIVFNVWDERD